MGKGSLRIVLAALLAAAPLAATAQPAPAGRSQVWKDGSVWLWEGERLTLRFGADGKPEVVSNEAAPAGDAQPPKPGKGGFADPPQGAVVFVAGRVGDRLMLKIESGISKSMDYRAELLSRASADSVMSQPVKACTVLPLLASYEDWPAQAATGLVLYGFTFRDTNDVVCPEPQQRPLRRERTP